MFSSSPVPPEFVRLPQNVSVAEGEPFTLECKAGGLPAPQLKWFLNDTRLYLDKFILDVASASKGTDEGEYRCLAENSAGSINATAFVSISSGESTADSEI